MKRSDFIPNLALFVASSTGLMAQVALGRLFDVALYPFASFLFLSTTMGWLSLGSAYSRYRSTKYFYEKFGVSLVAAPALLSLLGFALEQSGVESSTSFGSMFVEGFLVFLSICLVGLPHFFLGGYMTSIFAERTGAFPTRYGWDLFGAAAGGLAAVALIPLIAPGGVLICCLVCALLLSQYGPIDAPGRKIFILAAGVIFLAFGFGFKVDIYRSEPKQWMKSSYRTLETMWDLEAKIDLVEPQRSDIAGIAFFNGGTTSTVVYNFDGNYAALKKIYRREPESHFVRLGMVASHILRDGRGSKVYAIGPGAGQEIKAALLFGAKRVLAVDITGGLYKLLRKRFGQNIAAIFDDPRVEFKVGDGRKVLERTEEKFDIIQAFSNYLSSSVSAGFGAFDAEYLFTKEAFQLYFDRLEDDGILQINQFGIPRVIATATAAWFASGRDRIEEHIVAIGETGRLESLATVLIKKSPWTREEIQILKNLFEIGSTGFAVERSEPRYQFLYNPFHLRASPLVLRSLRPVQKEFIVNPSVATVTAATDDWPFFSYPSNYGLNGAHIATRWHRSILVWTVLAFQLAATLSAAGWAWRRSKRPRAIHGSYFAVGIAFFVAETFFVYAFARAFERPGYVFGSMLGSLLVGVGIGAMTTQWFRQRAFHALLVSATIIFSIAGLYPEIVRAGIVPTLFTALVGGIAMGRCFPLLVLQNESSVAAALFVSGLAAFLGGPIAHALVVWTGYTITGLSSGFLYLIAGLFALYTTTESSRQQA